MAIDDLSAATAVLFFPQQISTSDTITESCELTLSEEIHYVEQQHKSSRQKLFF